MKMLKRLYVSRNVFRRYSESVVVPESLDELLKTEDDNRPSDWDSALPYCSIPGPKALPLIGNLWRFMPGIGRFTGDPLDTWKKLRDTYGEVVKVDKMLVKPDLVYLFNPYDIENVFRNEGSYPFKELLPTIHYYRSQVRKDVYKEMGLVTTQGKTWFRIRNQANPILMQPRSAKMYVHTMDEIAGELVERIKSMASKDPNQEMPEDFQNELYKWSLESIISVALDIRLGCLDPNLKPNSDSQKLINDSLEVFNLIYQLDIKPSLWKYVSTPTWKKFVAAMDTIVDFAVQRVEETLPHVNLDKPEHEMSVFERLLKKDKNIAISVITEMFLGGVDTTSNTAAATLYHLAKNQEVQQKLREEIIQQLPNPNDHLTNEKLENMTYLRAAIRETMRITPVAILNLRTLRKDTILGGYQIPKGTQVFIPHLLLSRDENHFLEPNKYIPERWLRDSSDKYSHKNVHPFVSLPFGFGPRTCIGKRLANLEMEILLSKIIRNFSIHWNYEDPPFVTQLLSKINAPLKFQMKPIKY